MLSLQEMNELKRINMDTYRSIAERAGIPESTVQKVLSGITKTPRKSTMRSIQMALTAYHPSEDTDGSDPGVRESGYIYGSSVHARPSGQEEMHTVSDYEALPDDRRVELIDGVFYDMAAPTSTHQMVASEIFTQLRDFIRKKKGSCIPFIAPADVQIDCDDRTILEPDVFVVCDRSKITRQRIVGAPDLVIEVVSPASRSHDMRRKQIKYMEAGVREYWVVDIDRSKIIVYDFEADDIIIYSFTETAVPVRIFIGECTVDFAAIRDYVGFLL